MYREEEERREKEEKERERKREIPPNSGLTYRHFSFFFFALLIAGLLTDKIDLLCSSFEK